jgi:hypothetical protein
MEYLFYDHIDGGCNRDRKDGSRNACEFCAGDKRKVVTLTNLEAELDRSRLARADTLCQASLPEPERRWLTEHRPDEAKHWNLLTDWSANALRYAA